MKLFFLKMTHMLIIIAIRSSDFYITVIIKVIELRRLIERMLKITLFFLEINFKSFITWRLVSRRIVE